jgi:hypothetical protein
MSYNVKSFVTLGTKLVVNYFLVFTESAKGLYYKTFYGRN